MDYLVVGSNGFAQVGDPDYFTKAKIGLRILFEFLQANYPVPDEFASRAYYYIKAFNHDFGTYHEVVVIFDDDYLSTLEESELESDNELFNKFWNWFNSVESVDLESEDLIRQIRLAYQKTMDIEKGDHLKVIVIFGQTGSSSHLGMYRNSQKKLAHIFDNQINKFIFSW